MPGFEKSEATLLRYSLERPIGGSGVSAIDVVLAELTDSEGAEGFGFTYVIGGFGGEVVLRAVRSLLDRHVHDQPIVPPPALWRRIASSFNRTGLGPNLVALAAIDVAVWDLYAKRRGEPLGVAMGGVPRAVPVYGSGGFTARQTPEEAAEIAAAHAARGLRAVKPRVGGGRRDLAVMAAVRNAVPEPIDVMLDANEKCNIVTARWLLAAARDHGILFVEEPLRADDLEGYRALQRSGSAAVAAGEHLQGRSAFLPFVSEHLVDLVQPDLAMAGGLTPMLEIASIADAFGLAVSPHFLPGLFVHLAAACPAVAWLEEFPLLEPLFDGWPDLGPGGELEGHAAAGHGLCLAPGVRERFALS